MDRNDTTGLHLGADAPSDVYQPAGLTRISPAASLRNTILVNVRAHAVTPFKAPYINDYYVEAWSNAGPLMIAPGETIEIDVRYPVGPDNAGVGSFLSINSVGGGWPVEMECWSLPDKTGTRMDSSGSGDGVFEIIPEFVPGTSYTRPYGNNQAWAKVRFKNLHVSDYAFFFNCKVLVIGIRETGQAATAKVIDSASVTLNGSSILKINSKWVQTPAQGAATAQAYADVLSLREKAAPATITYRWSGQELYDNLVLYDLGTHVNFGAQGGATAEANFGMWGKWLVIGQVIDWIGSDGQSAYVKLTYEYIGTSPTLTFERASTQGGGTPAATITWPCRCQSTSPWARRCSSRRSTTSATHGMRCGRSPR